MKLKNGVCPEILFRFDVGIAHRVECRDFSMASNERDDTGDSALVNEFLCTTVRLKVE